MTEASVSNSTPVQTAPIIQDPITREMWKADIKGENGQVRTFEHKASGLNEFHVILKEKIKKGTVVAIWGAGR